MRIFRKTMILGSLAMIASPGFSQKTPEKMSVAKRAEQCEHWGGEEGYDEGRKREIAAAMEKLKCSELDPHEVWLSGAEQNLAKAEVEHCLEFFNSPQLKEAPTALARAGYSLASNCAKRAMNRNLDKRLLKIKQSDPRAFKLEMTSQKSFNQALNSHCGKVSAALAQCASAGDFRPFALCELQLFAYRSNQAKQMLASSLDLMIPSHGTTTLHAKAFSDFAKGLCQVDNSLWIGGNKIGASCETNVLASIGSQLILPEEVCEKEPVVAAAPAKNEKDPKKITSNATIQATGFIGVWKSQGEVTWMEKQPSPVTSTVAISKTADGQHYLKVEINGKAACNAEGTAKIAGPELSFHSADPKSNEAKNDAAPNAPCTFKIKRKDRSIEIYQVSSGCSAQCGSGAGFAGEFR